MIRVVTITNSFDEELKLDLFYPQETGVAITKIDGLYPVPATINTTEIVTTDGSIYNSARITERNIIFSLSFLSINGKSIEEIRQEIYRYFPSKEKVKITIDTDLVSYYIYGYVEKNSVEIFSKQESTQISIICPDPYFRSSDEEITVLYGVRPLFEFPFSNESLTEKLIEFGEIELNFGANIVYSGSGEVGMTIVMDIIGKVTDITIFNLTTRERLDIETKRLIDFVETEEFISGDRIVLSTRKGDKTIYLLRNGIYTNIFNCVTKESDWFPLRRGSNQIAYNATYGRTNIKFYVINEILYEGV